MPFYHYHDLIPPKRKSFQQLDTYYTFSCRNKYFNNSFFPIVLSDRNKLDPDICDSSNYNLFRKSLMKFIRPVERKTYNINDSVGTKLRFSHSREHKFRYSFKDTLNRFCSCSIETTTHCYFYNENRAIFIMTWKKLINPFFLH